LYLQRSGGLMALPLAVGALILMFGGWRIWKVAVVLSFGLVGGTVGMLIAKDPGDRWMYAAAGFLALGAISVPPVNYSVAVLGGVIGGALCHYVSLDLGLGGVPLWLVTLLGLGICTAVSFIYLRQIIIVVTSFEGAVLLVSAAVALLSTTPRLFNYFRTMAYEGSIFLPFVVLVPTVIGTMCQMADVNRKGVSIVRR